MSFYGVTVASQALHRQPIIELQASMKNLQTILDRFLNGSTQ
jgi:hypothetical protein